jgi:integrase
VLDKTTTKRTRKRAYDDAWVAKLKQRRGHKGPRDPIPDPGTPISHYIFVYDTGRRVFYCAARDSVSGKQVWHKIGEHRAIVAGKELTIERSREIARTAIGRIKAGESPQEPQPPTADTLHAVAANWLAREAKSFRTRADIERRLHRYLLPALGRRILVKITRSEIAKLLDTIEDDHGKRTADHVLGDLRALCNWHAARTDGYSPPFVKKMRRGDNVKRDRVLDDGELCLIWAAAERPEAGAFGAIVRLALLTGQRREKLISMAWSDLDLDIGLWRIPYDPVPAGQKVREKSHGGDLILPPVALDIIRAQPRFASSPWVFPAARGPRHVTAVSTMKAAFDALLPPFEKGKGWTTHDLRRTSATLMARARVTKDHIERVLGHVLGAIHGIYNRHDFKLEKATALMKLAAQIETILNPPAGNVVTLHRV